MAGYAHTAVEWAANGHNGASWHYTVARDGTIYQHLEHTDGGYQAGIIADMPDPTWPLWRGDSQNINNYSLGVEHEGFPGETFAPQQAEASRNLCRWLATDLGIDFDHEHFPAHAEIDLVNRVNDFNTPDLRVQFYAFLFDNEEDALTKEEKEQLDSLIAWREQVMTQLYDHDIGPIIDAYVVDNEGQVLTLQNINCRLGGALATAQGGAPSTSIPPHQHKSGPTGGVL